jgi:hypothetical protein
MQPRLLVTAVTNTLDDTSKNNGVVFHICLTIECMEPPCRKG